MYYRKIKSNQVNVMFSYCPHPVTIDKSKEWGEGNLQHFPDGVYFKHAENNPMDITHGVQPDDSGDAPVGWIKDHLGTFEKKPIFIGESLKEGIKIELRTLDGVMDYEVKVPSIMCYNEGQDGGPNFNDCYVQSLDNLGKNYHLD